MDGVKRCDGVGDLRKGLGKILMGASSAFNERDKSISTFLLDVHIHGR